MPILGMAAEVHVRGGRCRHANQGATDLITELMERKSACESALEYFEEAADQLGLSPEIRSVLKRPEREAWVRVPVRMADGRVERVDGCIVEHNTSRGPAKGGVRCHAGVTLEEIEALAMSMTWSWALADLPFGGGKGGIAVDPSSLAQGELPRLTGDGLSIAPPTAVEDTPPAREEAVAGAVGRGIYSACLAGCGHLRVRLDQARVVIQGFGRTGSAAAMLLAESRAKITAASDTRGAIYNAFGLDVAELVRHKERTGSVVGFSGAEPITDFELLGMESDLLVASAASGSIHSGNAPAIRCRILAEAAGGGITPNAEAILRGADVLVIPDRLCHAARQAAGYFHGVQQEDTQLDSVVKRAFQDVLAMSLEQKAGMHRAADMVGIRRVAESMRRPYGLP